MKYNYGAIAYKGKYRVAYWYNIEQPERHFVGNCRSFDTFEEADKVARDIAAGRCDWEPGAYVNMR